MTRQPARPPAGAATATAARLPEGGAGRRPQRAGWQERQPEVARVPAECAGCLRQRQMRRERCPWRKGRGQVLRTPHPARTPLLGRSCLQDKTLHPARTPLLGRNLLLAKNLCPTKTHLPAKNPLQVQKPRQVRMPHQARGPPQPQTSHPARTLLLVKNLRHLVKTSLRPQSTLPRPLRPVETCLPAGPPHQPRPLPRKPRPLGTRRQLPRPCLPPPDPPS